MKPYTVVDLSHRLEMGMPSPGLLPRLGIWPCALQDWGDKVNCQAMIIAEHVGTNCDAPYHVLSDGATIDQLPVDAFMGPAVLVDMRAKRPQSTITADEIRAWEAQSGVEIRAGEIVVVMTGFDDKHWMPIPSVSNALKRRPALGMDAAEYLVSKQVKAVGMDTGSPDVTGTDLPVHRYLLGQGCLIVECLTNLHAIGASRFFFIALPLNIKGGSGSTCRAVALVGAPAALA